ncbi:SIR2 family protein [Arthrobacter sp. NEB 688]|uniref:SIR2 family NAD-dependent protein deacylase n=1 Tax=Arthrobacter sp. NEB 688 TaxID=904039 RepID=UPI0015674823|nr:SIR2 family protein [Arthrobacter sp. NEB 688]QKE84400.1 SIR2 family protein [Arthrobacter sp. NEB 688]
MEGHLFAVLGDLTRLDTDAVVIPCDFEGNVSHYWKPLLPEKRFDPGPYGHRLRDGLTAPPGEVTIAAGDRRLSLAVTAAREPLPPCEVVDRAVQAVLAAARDLASHRGRHLPLVSLPLVGTGLGGHSTERRRVVELLVPALIDLTRREGVDVALVLNDRRDYAAVQAERGRSSTAATDPWSGLSTDGQRQADDLGRLAARGALSLFVGSGVSVPLGLPNWRELMVLMGQRAGVTYEVPEDANLLDEAAGLRWLLRSDYAPFMRKTFERKHHALGHALLAALGVQRMVTTNYDPCLELALDGVHRADYAVMTRNLATGERPWLLKIHGDVKDPESMVLTRADYERLADEGRALHGVVESLMLTSHVMFVGYSLVDHDFADVAHGVKLVRDRAETLGARPPSGTALALHPGAVDEDRWLGEVDVVAMGEADELPAAPRTLEIFLDRVAWACLDQGELAAEFLLDDRYAAGADPADVALRQALEVVAANPEVRGSVGWRKVEGLLTALGHVPGPPAP